jgi:hypothetical protein
LLNLTDVYDIIYHSDWFLELSSEMWLMWSCDFTILPYIVITIKFAKFYWCIWCYIYSDWFFEPSSDMLLMWSCDFILLPYMVITIKFAKSYWYICCYIPFWLIFWAEFRNVIDVVMWPLPIAIYGNYHQIDSILLMYMMLYIILTRFLSWL